MNIALNDTMALAPTSCAHQAQLGWMRRHSSQDVALPLIHTLRPEKTGKLTAGLTIIIVTLRLSFIK